MQFKHKNCLIVCQFKALLNKLFIVNVLKSGKLLMDLFSFPNIHACRKPTCRRW